MSQDGQKVHLVFPPKGYVSKGSDSRKITDVSYPFETDAKYVFYEEKNPKDAIECVYLEASLTVAKQLATRMIKLFTAEGMNEQAAADLKNLIEFSQDTASF